jgi:hypothetical protein
MEKIAEAGAGFRFLTEHIDTTTPAGRMMMQKVGAFADDAESAVMRSDAARIPVTPGIPTLGCST